MQSALQDYLYFFSLGNFSFVLAVFVIFLAFLLVQLLIGFMFIPKNVLNDRFNLGNLLTVGLLVIILFSGIRVLLSIINLSSFFGFIILSLFAYRVYLLIVNRRHLHLIIGVLLNTFSRLNSSIILLSFLITFIYILPPLTGNPYPGTFLTSVDTSRGDMSSYLVLSDVIKNEGFATSPNLNIDGKVDVVANIAYILKTGSGGHLYLSFFGLLINLPTWKIGMSILLLLIFTNYVIFVDFLRNNVFTQNNFRSLFMAIFLPSILLFGINFGRTTGWWALNQIICLTLIVFTFSLVLKSIEDRRLYPIHIFIFSLLSVMIIVIYPSIGVIWFFTLASGLFVLGITSKDLKFIFSIFSKNFNLFFAPLLFIVILFNKDFLEYLNSNATGQNFDIGRVVPSILSLLNIVAAPDIPLVNVTSLSSINIATVIIITFCIYVVWRHRSPQNVITFTLLASWSLLLILANLNGLTGYVSHKAIMSWWPIFILLAITILKNYALNRKIKNFMIIPAALTFVAYSSIFSVLYGAQQWRDVLVPGIDKYAEHSIAPDIYSLSRSPEFKSLEYIFTDTGNGEWIPMDRVIMPALYSLEGPFLQTGAFDKRGLCEASISYSRSEVVGANIFVNFPDKNIYGRFKIDSNPCQDLSFEQIPR